ncbi:MAG: hypothetical protein IT423_16895, partial [Pirellulaceae bacterium]|nr:hypothetical protein [Pirellulaceae bacterium]
MISVANSGSLLWGLEPSYVRDIQPLLRKYCGGCHNEADKEGDFSVATFQSLMKGTPDGQVVASGDASKSKLLMLIKAVQQPKMPPEDEAQPTAAEIAIIEQWIAAGARNDADSIPLDEQIKAPMLLADADSASFITAMIDAGDKLVAVARLGSCELRDAVSQQVLFQVADVPGKINQLRMSSDGQFLLISGGLAGVGGQVVIVDIQQRKVVGRIQGHTDAIYCATMSPDGQFICTGSYDRSAWLWDWRNKQVVRRFTGHNGAIYDLDIDPEGKVLATASGDQTIKLWGLSNGNRLDTLGQPEGEMLCVRFTPDGRYVLASGADRQLRMWELLSKDQPAINPLRLSRFAHEEPVTQIYFRGVDQIISLSEDRTVKLWQLPDLRPVGVITRCNDVPTGIGKLGADSKQFLVADYRGSLSAVTPPAIATSEQVNPNLSEAANSVAINAFKPAAAMPAPPAEAVAEIEPNDRLAQAQVLTLPARVRGLMAAEADGRTDSDLFAFETKAGMPWVIEVQAARDKSPLDSLID